MVLNYDTLLEQAMLLYDGHRFSFSGINGFVESGRQANVFKVHGSVDWYVELERVGSWRGTEREVEFRFPPKPWNELIRVERAYPQAKRDHIQRHGRYPVLTAPMAGKIDGDLVAPESHIRALREFASECEKVLFIGTSGLDDDVLRVLAQHLPTLTTVHVVGAGTVDKSALSIASRVPQVNAVGRLEFAGGFRQYVASDRFREFASGKPTTSQEQAS